MKHISQSEEEKRPYHSQVRQRQAEETRRRILVAARELFESRGYAVTTVEAIAEVAEVSPKTVTAVFGSKRVLLAEVINPEAFSTHVRQLIEELRALEDPSRRLSLVAQITRQAYEPLASSLELLRTANWDQTGESRVYVPPRKAAEEQQQSEKREMLSFLPPEITTAVRLL